MSSEIDLEELKRLAQAANEWRVREAQPNYDPRKEAEAFGMDMKGADSLRLNHVSKFTSAINPAAVLALIERVEMAEAFARRFAEAVEGDLANEEAWQRGGMRPATLTGDFVRLPPSAKGRIRWWAKRAREALGKTGGEDR